ncbi:hypothetical protein [Desulfatitalea tepidiphila]|uniref:hypothetical protein n=1 Tax=Desulfatitalea tepidiphila TaxID=1185843 RepID=UPI0006B606B2|nr:hypothetical protein [Desulfatitalea tepidiphila]
MAYRKVPKRFDYRVIAAEIKAQLLYSNDSRPDAVQAIAAEMGIDNKTVYDYLDGRIKLSLDFLHALVLATDGDPAFKRYLEPDGWQLRRAGTIEPDKKTIFEEIVDNHPKITLLEQLLIEQTSATGKKSQLNRIKKQLQAVVDDLRQDVAKWCVDHGIETDV